MIGKRIYILFHIMIIAYSFDERFGWLLCIMLPAYGIYQLYKLHTEYFRVEAVCITYCQHWISVNRGGHTEYDGVYKYTIDNKEYITTESETHRSFKPKVNEKCVLYVNKNDYECILPQSVVKYWCIMPLIFVFFYFILPVIVLLILFFKKGEFK